MQGGIWPRPISSIPFQVLLKLAAPLACAMETRCPPALCAMPSRDRCSSRSSLSPRPCSPSGAPTWFIAVLNLIIATWSQGTVVVPLSSRQSPPPPRSSRSPPSRFAPQIWGSQLAMQHSALQRPPSFLLRHRPLPPRPFPATIPAPTRRHRLLLGRADRIAACAFYLRGARTSGLSTIAHTCGPSSAVTAPAHALRAPARRVLNWGLELQYFW